MGQDRTCLLKIIFQSKFKQKCYIKYIANCPPKRTYFSTFVDSIKRGSQVHASEGLSDTTGSHFWSFLGSIPRRGRPKEWASPCLRTPPDVNGCHEPEPKVASGYVREVFCGVEEAHGMDCWHACHHPQIPASMDFGICRDTYSCKW